MRSTIKNTSWPSLNEIGIPYEYIDYVIYNYNHNAIPKETLDKVLECYQLSFDDISDKINICSEEEEDVNLEDVT